MKFECIMAVDCNFSFVPEHTNRSGTLYRTNVYTPECIHIFMQHRNCGIWRIGAVRQGTHTHTLQPQTRTHAMRHTPQRTNGKKEAPNAPKEHIMLIYVFVSLLHLLHAHTELAYWSVHLGGQTKVNVRVLPSRTSSFSEECAGG